MSTSVSQPPLPKAIFGPSAWNGEELQKDMSWMVNWTQEEIQELVEAGNYFLSLHKSLEQIAPEFFPIPSLSKRIKAFSNELLFGRGFLLIRGLPIDR